MSDTGRGLTSDQLAQVFDRFYRVDRSAVGSPGIGLTIARSPGPPPRRRRHRFVVRARTPRGIQWVRAVRIFPDSRRRLAWTTCLAALAITGLLFMHGFDAAAIDLIGTDHHDSGEDAAAIHGVIGLCVFVVAATGLIATRWPARSRRQLPAPVSATVTAAVIEAVRRVGRPRLFELCVLRA